jgi:hypothetical protein
MTNWPYNQILAECIRAQVPRSWHQASIESVDQVMKFFAAKTEAPNVFLALGGTTEVVPFPSAVGMPQGGQGNNGA